MNKKLSVVVLLLFFPIFISCKKSIQSEIEPNNDFFSSNIINTDTVIEGLLDTPTDQDFFKLDLVNPCVADIELSPVKGLNHAIKIWKDNGQTLLKYIDDSRKSSPERMCNIFFNTGTYYITVLHGDKDTPQGNKENHYQLQVSARSWDAEEKEPNDTYDMANPIEIGREIKGYFSPAFNKLNQSATSPFREEDWYYFNIDLIDNNPVLLNINLSGVPEVNSVLSVFDGNANEIVSSNNGKPDEGEALEIGIVKSGTYYIMVASNFESNNSIPYTLQTEFRVYDYSSEIEPNNDFEKANLITGNELKGRIYPEGDSDYFLFSREKNTEPDSIPVDEKDERFIYRIEALSEGSDLVMKIFDNNKREVFEIDNIKGGGREVMPDAFFKDNFYIELSAKRGEILGSEYLLNVSYSPYSEDLEIEPNDTKETANKIKSDRITGYISKAGDKDFYLLEYNKRVRKKLTLHGIKDAELKFSITDPLGFIIRTESVKDDNSITFNEMIDARGYLIVESVLDNYDAPYTIELGE